ncbi:hypothetical protein [Streptomyces sp. NPDC006355]|uniref:hypothetical protein n=1 Tax=Streptomyces sp. NPDC006355 TaxID=3156758 RepID=UPI0033A59393
MAFYRDDDGAIWQDGHPDVLYCIVDPDDEPNTKIGIPIPWYEVSDSFGPLISVRPTGWEEV